MSQRVRPEVAGRMTSSATCGNDCAGCDADPGYRFAHPGYLTRARTAAMTSGIAASLPGAMMWTPPTPGMVE
jgi:hypothetical protein